MKQIILLAFCIWAAFITYTNAGEIITNYQQDMKSASNNRIQHILKQGK